MRRRPPRVEPAPSKRPDWRSYDSVAELYDRVRAPLHEAPATDLVGLLDLQTGERVLDVGTGTGVAARAAGAAVGEDGLVVGLDPSWEMLRRADNRGVSRLVAGRALDLPFADATFDVVTAAFVIFFFKKYQTALHDLHRVLRRRGRIGVTTWGPGEDEFRRTWREAAEAFVGRDLLRDAMKQGAPWEQLFSDPARLKDVLREAGFRDIRVERRDYRHTVTLEDYVSGRETSVTGRFLRGMLGEEAWRRFHDRVSEEFRNRFPDPIGDTNDVLLAVAVKPE